MKSKNNFERLFEPGFIIFLWLSLFIYPFLLDSQQGEINWTQLYRNWTRNIPLIIAFIINRFILLPYLFFNNKRVSYFLAALSLITALTIGAYFYENDRAPKRTIDPTEKAIRTELQEKRRAAGINNFRLQQRRAKRKTRPIVRTATISFLCIMIIILDTGLRATMKLSKSKKENDALANENIRNKLAFLRSQVSPHFLMNTLNNIHALIDIEPAEAKESIIKLSKLMRHLLYGSESNMIDLKKEIEFISSYVNLMKLRYSKNVKVTLQVPSEIPSIRIPSLLFTSILENAFNYGISSDRPSFIDIVILCEDDQLDFLIKNSNYYHLGKTSSSGIGLANTRKRLDILFGDRYIMEVSDNDEIFTVHLNLPI